MINDFPQNIAIYVLEYCIPSSTVTYYSSHRNFPHLSLAAVPKTVLTSIWLSRPETTTLFPALRLVFGPAGSPRCGFSATPST